MYVCASASERELVQIPGASIRTRLAIGARISSSVRTTLKKKKNRSTTLKKFANSMKFKVISQRVNIISQVQRVSKLQ